MDWLKSIGQGVVIGIVIVLTIIAILIFMCWAIGDFLSTQSHLPMLS